MNAASVYWDIMGVVQQKVGALALNFNQVPVQVKIRKLPAKEETLDQLPLICVCPHTIPEDIQQLSFEDDCGIQKTYYLEVVIVASGGRDLYNNLDVWMGWREKINRLFQKPPLDVGSARVFQMLPDPEYVLARDEVNDNYDYSGMGFWFTAAEPRAN